MIHRSVAHLKVRKQSHSRVAHHSVVHHGVEGIFPEMTHPSVAYLWVDREISPQIIYPRVELETHHRVAHLSVIYP